MSERLLGRWSLFASTLVVACLVAVIGFVVIKGGPTLSLALLFGDADPWAAMLGNTPVWEGIWPACVGTLKAVLLALALALVPGIATGLYLVLTPHSRFSQALAFVVDLLAGIPSVLMGLFGFTLIVFLKQHLFASAGSSLLLSSTCLAMLVLPYLAMATRMALMAQPLSLEVTALSLGMTPWQALWHVRLPEARMGIVAGVILALGRAAEDTAVIMLTGAVASAGLAGGLFERFQALPFTIFYYGAQYQSEFELQMAFGAALILLILTASLSTLVVALVGGYQQRVLSPNQGQEEA